MCLLLLPESFSIISTAIKTAPGEAHAHLLQSCFRFTRSVRWNPERDRKKMKRYNDNLVTRILLLPLLPLFVVYKTCLVYMGLKIFKKQNFPPPLPGRIIPFQISNTSSAPPQGMMVTL